MKDSLYTLRWIANKIAGTSAEKSTQDAAKEQLVILEKLIGDKPEAPPVVKPAPSKEKGLLYWPEAYNATAKLGLKMKTKGKYAKGYPRGVVVHFTAGRYIGGLEKAIDSIRGGIKNSFAFDVIAFSGELVHGRPINEWGYHAGASKWDKVKHALVGSVSDDLLGIEMNNAGKVEKIDDNKFKTWFGTYLSRDEVRYVEEKTHGCPTGYYHKYTPEQEKTLIDYILFLKANDPAGCFELDLVLGHHEVSPGRKNDPGGALSMSMAKFRELLKTEYARV